MMPTKLSVCPRKGQQSLTRELRVALRMMPRMYLVPLRNAWRLVANRWARRRQAWAVEPRV